MTLPALLLSACLPLLGDGDRITAADLATGEPAFSALPPETSLALAPLPGSRRVFRVHELEQLASPYGLSLVQKTEVCLERTVAPLEPSRLLSAMHDTLAQPEVRIELLEYSRYPAPRGAVEFSLSDLARPPVAATQSAVLWKGVVRYGSSGRFAIWARVRILLRTECVVAARTLMAGHPIEPAQLRHESYLGFPLFDSPVTAIEQAANHVPRRTIPAGAPVLAGALDAPYDVSRGEMVEVEVASGEAHLKLQARAEADARRGQVIFVVNPATGKRFQAHVVSIGRVAVGIHP